MKPDTKPAAAAPAQPQKSVKLKKPHEHKGVLLDAGETIPVSARTAAWIKANGIGDIQGEAAPTA